MAWTVYLKSKFDFPLHPKNDEISFEAPFTVEGGSMWRRISVSAVLSSRVAPSAQREDNTMRGEEASPEAVSGETHM